MKFFLKHILKHICKRILRKYNPEIIAITGSIGKSSTKDAIYYVLKDSKKVRVSYHNYNDELGVPLTIIGMKNPGRSIRGWLKVISKGRSLARAKKEEADFPEILILELGIERPGDMKHLAGFIKPVVIVLTGISKMPSHLEYFKDLNQLTKEKFEILKSIKKDFDKSIIIYNYDSLITKKNIRKYAKDIRSEGYGFGKGATITASDVYLTKKSNGEESFGLNFKITDNGVTLPFFIPKLIARYQLYPILASISVSLVYELNLIETSIRLKQYKLPQGRMNLIKGIKDSFIIDDTYNSSPDAVLAAMTAFLNLYKFFQLKEGIKGRKILVEGDMLELGKNENKAHKLVAEKIIKNKIADHVFLVGERMRKIEKILSNSGKLKTVKWFEDSADCATVLESFIRQHDLILVKGSQGVRMEKIVEAIMADKSKKKLLLARQDELWEKR